MKSTKIQFNKEEYSFSYWGPFLFKTFVNPNLSKLIYKHGLECKELYNHKLAGQMKKEFSYSKDIKKIIHKNLKPYFEYYFEAQKEHYGAHSKINKIKLLDLWINFQQKNEYNPIHTHGICTHSFVLYCSIPKKIKEEYIDSKNKTKFTHPGGIVFLYGEGSQHDLSSSITTHSFFPEENMLFIFPSTLRHQVFPFKSNAVRVSVSGNITVS